MISRTVCDDHAAEQMPTTSRVGRYRKHNSVATGASQHRTVAKGGRVVVLSRTPLALLFVCSTAPLSSQPAVVSGERGTEHDGDWPEAEGWLGRRDEMSGEVEIAFFFPRAHAPRRLPFVLACAARDKKNRSENERGLAGGLVRLRARIKEHQISQANARRKSANEKTHRF